MAVDVTRIKYKEDAVGLSHHRCDWRKWKHLLTPDGEFDRSKMTDEDDVLVWAIGLYGRGLPRDVGFQATAQCPACGEYVNRWFLWT